MVLLKRCANGADTLETTERKDYKEGTTGNKPYSVLPPHLYANLQSTEREGREEEACDPFPFYIAVNKITNADKNM